MLDGMTRHTNCLSYGGNAVALLLIASALGMDALSLGMAVGLRIKRRLQIVQMSTLVGLFHLLMPLLGMTFGAFIHHWMGSFAPLLAGGLLALLGGHMVIQAWRGNHSNESKMATITWWGMVGFAFSVSLDSLSVGVSLGIAGAERWLAVVMFACCAMIMSGIGLSLGKIMKQISGRYGECISGIILAVIGLKLMYESLQMF